MSMNPERPLSEAEMREHIDSMRESSDVTKLTSEAFFQRREEIETMLRGARMGLDQFRYEVDQSPQKINSFTEAKSIRWMEQSTLLAVESSVRSFLEEYGLAVRIDWKTMNAEDIISAIEQAYKAKLHDLEHPE